MKSSRVLQRVLPSLALCLIAAVPAGATEIFDPSPSSSNVINTSAVQLDGTIFAFGADASVWTINAYAVAGECLRLDVSAQPVDMEMVVVAPNGNVYRNDDRNGATDRRPLVQIAGVPVTGWYTVHVAKFDGSAVVGDFTLLYGRYTAGNANCAQPTVVLNSQAASFSSMIEEENATTLKEQTESIKSTPKRSDSRPK